LADMIIRFPIGTGKLCIPCGNPVKAIRLGKGGLDAVTADDLVGSWIEYADGRDEFLTDDHIDQIRQMWRG